jgi:hypothetical protein
MKKKATRNHPESAGVERVDHDGETEVVEPEDIEVSQKERLEWYYNGSAKDEDKVLHKKKNIETSYDDGGNPMWVNEEHRTSLPRPHQYSIERRLQEEREPGSTYDIISDASVENATARAFTMISPIVQAGRDLNDSEVVKISKVTGVPVQNVMSLENIAKRNSDLVNKYASIPGVVEDSDEPGIEKESEPQCYCKCRGKKLNCKCPDGCSCRSVGSKQDGELLKEDELNQIGTECGLC